MKLDGSNMINADIATVWKGLNNPDILKVCIPGCEEFTGTAEEGYEAKVTQKIGPVKATFRGKVTLSDIVEMKGYRITGEGKGGAAGFASGSASVTLEQSEESTELRYDVDAKVGGKLAQLGSRVVGGVARKLADEFFTRFQQAIEDVDNKT